MIHRVLKKHHKRIQEIGGGLFSYELFNFLYDWFLYPFSIARWGLEIGGTVMLMGSLIQCALFFWLYDRMRVDWLGAHALRELQEKEHKNRFEHMAVWIHREKKTLWEKLISPIVFIVLTLPIDPLIVALHYRKKHFGGVSARDWGILIAAVFVANVWWLVKIGAVITVIHLILLKYLHAGYSAFL
ncbi:MAG: hypothetical protein ABIQ91_01465 [Candidatus Paceibacterota bacterium]